LKSKTLNLPPDKTPSEDAPVHDPRETFLTDAQVEQRWNVASGYMSELRAQGTGPPHVRLSPRIIRYRLESGCRHTEYYRDAQIVRLIRVVHALSPAKSESEHDGIGKVVRIGGSSPSAMPGR
jgi:hypothetical protein